MLDVWWAPLQAALAGDGPALLPVPDGPGADSVLAMADVDAPVADDIALVVPTSGSTGESKGALLSAAALQHSARSTLDRLGGPGTWLLALPVTHIAGLQVLVRSLLAEREPACLDATDGFRVTAFVQATGRLAGERRYTALVPAQLLRLLDGGADAVAALASYDGVLVGGAATPAALLDRARGAGVRVLTTYGMTETAGGCVYDGVPLEGVQVAVDDDGRVRLGGPTVFHGYRGRPDLTESALEAVDGVRWHVTNDLGRLYDGRLEVLGRRDDVIITGGENVSPLPVEAALAAVPGISQAAVVGLPDSQWGERVVAVVVASGARPTLDTVREALVDLPGHARPRQLVVVDALPLLPSGKLDRDAVRARLAGG